MVERIYFLGFFLREASRNEDCNAVPELENHNLYLSFQPLQIKNQTVGWVVMKRYSEPHDHGGVCTEGKTPGEAR